MKKILFILMAFMVSFSVYAQDNTNVEEVSVKSNSTVVDIIYLSKESLTSPEPIVITVSLPSDVREVLNVSHPCQPGYLPNWSFGNGSITITIPAGDMVGASEGDIKIYARDAIYHILYVVV